MNYASNINIMLKYLLYWGKLIITLKITGSSIFVDPETSDQLSSTRVNASHISDIHRTFQQTAWPPAAEGGSCCDPFVLVSTFANGTVAWEAASCQTVGPSSLHSPLTSNSPRIFTQKIWSCPKNLSTCDFLKNYVGRCPLQLKDGCLWGQCCPFTLQHLRDFLRLNL